MEGLRGRVEGSEVRKTERPGHAFRQGKGSEVFTTLVYCSPAHTQGTHSGPDECFYVRAHPGDHRPGEAEASPALQKVPALPAEVASVLTPLTSTLALPVLDFFAAGTLQGAFVSGFFCSVQCL